MVTLAGTEEDKEEAAKLILLKKLPLLMTLELDESTCLTGGNRSNEENFVEARTKRKSRRQTA